MDLVQLASFHCNRRPWQLYWIDKRTLISPFFHIALMIFAGQREVVTEIILKILLLEHFELLRDVIFKLPWQQKSYIYIY